MKGPSVKQARPPPPSFGGGGGGGKPLKPQTVQHLRTQLLCSHQKPLTKKKAQQQLTPLPLLLPPPPPPWSASRPSSFGVRGVFASVDASSEASDSGDVVSSVASVGAKLPPCGSKWGPPESSCWFPLASFELFVGFLFKQLQKGPHKENPDGLVNKARALPGARAWINSTSLSRPQSRNLQWVRRWVKI